MHDYKLHIYFRIRNFSMSSENMELSRLIIRLGGGKGRRMAHGAVNTKYGLRCNSRVLSACLTSDY